MVARLIRLEPQGLQPMEIYILAGQSNSDGRGSLSDVPTFAYGYCVKSWTRAEAWVDAADPLGDETGAVYPVLSDGKAGVCAGISFGSSLAVYRGQRDVGLVHSGKGSTFLGEWTRNLSTSTLYGAMLARTRAALSAAPAGAAIKGLIWYQGESETTNAALAGNWASTFLTMYDHLVADLGVPGLKAIVTEIGINPAGYTYWGTVQAQQRSLDGARDGAIACVSAADLAGIVGNQIHLTTASQVTLGQRYAARMAAMLAD